jgi:hypothetical protein
MRNTRQSIGSYLIANLDSKIKERLLNLPIKKEQLKKFDDQEKREILTALVDLRDLSTKTETEVYDTLNRMYKNKQ